MDSNLSKKTVLLTKTVYFPSENNLFYPFVVLFQADGCIGAIR